ncbi:MAG: DNA polymerase, partial [Solimonas sp.]
RLIWPRDSLRDRDFARVKQGRLPAKLAGNHSLEAFGYRLGLMKGDYSDWCEDQGIDPWAVCRPEMVDYGVQDVQVTHALWNRIVTENYSAEAAAVEHATAWHIAQMERNGFPFNEQEAAKLYAHVVQERDALERQLKTVFAPWYVPDTTTEVVEDGDGTKRKVRTPAITHPKKTIKYKNRPWVIEGASYTKVTQVEFNPASRDHIADRLTKLYGWKPPAFTDNGQPIVDETTLSGLNYPAARLLSRYLLLQKRAGQISEGNEGWLKVSRDGHVFGGVNTIGAVTRRATHMRPNIAQVPKVGSYFGAECRALFWAGRAADGTLFVQCGADLSGIELRMLAHYMARYDGGAYAEAVVNGSSEQGTDVHSVNCRALGFDPKQVYVIAGKSAKGRDIAKTFIYAFLYGAGAAKLASILGLPESKGAAVKKRFLAALPALGMLIEAVQQKAKTHGYLIGLDGGRLRVRSAHSALNTLLQSAGAIVAKY